MSAGTSHNLNLNKWLGFLYGDSNPFDEDEDFLMSDESLDVKVAVLQNDMKHVKEKMDKALAWGRWIGMSVGGYIVLQLLEVFNITDRLGN